MRKDRNHAKWVAALVRALQDGTVVDLAPGEKIHLTKANLTKVESWPKSRGLPGEALRDALLNSDIKPDPRGLKIRAAYITGITDLADLRLSLGLQFDSCVFEQPADWSRLTVASLRLTDCTMSGLTLDHAHKGQVLSVL